MKKYDYIVVGAGLYGATFARLAADKGLKCLVLDRRTHIAGNVYTEPVEAVPKGGEINVHKYGAHIFHTNNEEVWRFVNKYAKFNRFTNSPVARYKDELYSLPFSMWTFTTMWPNVRTPEQAAKKIAEQKSDVERLLREKGQVDTEGNVFAKNLEEQALLLVGRDIYEKLIRDYTQKQWGRNCTELPPFIIKRLPVRFTFDNNYFNALYQGIPIGGYTVFVQNLLESTNITVKTSVDFLKDDFEVNKNNWREFGKSLLYTGAIDEYYDYVLGPLQYRSVRFENEVLSYCDSFQGNAAVNYTDIETPWTRIIEHKWFEFGKTSDGKDIKGTIISREYSSEWKVGDEPYYPVNDEKNNDIYSKYLELSKEEDNIIFGGRLGEYKYYDMDKTIEMAMKKAEGLL